MKYSIIIPAYNAEATIEQCLNSVIQQEFQEPYEILVVDSSDDKTPEIIKQKFSQVQLIHLSKKTVPGEARNIGVEKSRGEIICFIDSDCIAKPDWLARIVNVHRRKYAAVGGSIANGNPESLIGWAGYFAEFREFFPFHSRQIMTNIPTCNISYKRWVFDKYGGFPDLMPDRIIIKHPQQEDLIFNLNLSINKHPIIFDPAIQVAHINMTSFKQFVFHEYRIGRSTSQLLRYYPGLPGHFIVRSWGLTLLATPLLPFIKYFNTLRIAMLSKEYLRNFMFSAPLLAIGLFFWGFGFLKGRNIPLKSAYDLST